jgi:hypothetical protein
MAFIGAERKPLTEEADGSVAAFSQEGMAIELWIQNCTDYRRTNAGSRFEKYSLAGFVFGMKEIAEADTNQPELLFLAETDTFA